jgi:hypothetical protein
MSHDMRTVWDNDLGEPDLCRASLCSVGVAKVTHPSLCSAERASESPVSVLL